MRKYLIPVIASYIPRNLSRALLKASWVSLSGQWKKLWDVVYVSVLELFTPLRVSTLRIRQGMELRDVVHLNYPDQEFPIWYGRSAWTNACHSGHLSSSPSHRLAIYPFGLSVAIVTWISQMWRWCWKMHIVGTVMWNITETTWHLPCTRNIDRKKVCSNSNVVLECKSLILRRSSYHNNSKHENVKAKPLVVMSFWESPCALHTSMPGQQYQHINIYIMHIRLVCRVTCVEYSVAHRLCFEFTFWALNLVSSSVKLDVEV